MDSSATPISLTADSCVGADNRCHIATPAPSTPFPYSPLTPYTTHPYNYFSRYSTSSAAHLQNPYNSPLNSFASLAYPPDLFHYNPYSALTPTSPLTPSSFWSLTAQQSYHQLSGLSFGPSSMGYNTSTHLYNLFSPNSISSLSPNPDLHSPYPRVSSLPTPYASSPGLSSAFMSPSSMPLLLSPSLSSSVDRPPTYLSDSTSTPSTTASMTPSIKCEPGELNCNSHQNSQQINHFNDSINTEERNIERIDNTINNNNEQNSNRNIKSKLDNNNKSIKTTANETQKQSQQQLPQKTITTTITSIPTKSKEKHSARVEPLMRIQETIETVVRNGSDIKRKDNIEMNTEFDNKSNNSCETTVNTRNESPIKSCIKDNNNLNLNLMNAKVKRELIECDMSLPLNSVNSVPNNNVINNNIVIENNNQLKTKTDSIAVKIDNNCNNNNKNNKNLVMNELSVKSSDGNESLINSKKEKDAKRESQLKQLQSYRKESHRISKSNDNKNKSGVQSTAAISIVLPKQKDQTIAEHQKSLTTRPVPQSSKTSNESLMSSAINSTNSSTAKSPITSTKCSVSVPVVESHKPMHPKTQSVNPVRTKSIQNISNTTITTNQTKQTINSRKLDNSSVDTITANTQKLSQQNSSNTNNTNKQLPKKPRISRKPSSASIPVGIAIAQQRTSPKTKSPTDSANISASNATQPLKPILPTLSLPMVANSPILITDSPPAGTSLWIKPTTNSTINTNNSLQTGSQFSITGDYQLARDSLTGQLYLIRNSSSLPTTPTTPKAPAIIPALTIKSNEHQSKSGQSTIITLPVGATQPQQFFASLGPTPTSTLILDTRNNSPLVQIAASAPVTSVMPNISTNNATTFTTNNNNIKIGRQLDVKDVKDIKDSNHSNTNCNLNNLNVERGTQACISDDEVFNCDNMKTTATQVDMDHIHSSEEDDDNEGKRHKLILMHDKKHVTDRNSSIDDEESSRDSVQLTIVDDRCEPVDEAMAPVLPVKSAPVMQFIDHHGLDLLVDSIEEFAAREEGSNASTSEPVDGLQLLSALAEQRSIEERGGPDGSPFRRHSADSHVVSNLNNNNFKNELSLMKKRQRSESCFTSSPIIYDENEESLSDIKKLMKTSSSQTELFDRRRRQLSRFDEELNTNSFNLRRSERIFIHDSVVVATKDTKDVNIDGNKDKDLVNNKDSKKKESDIKLKIVKLKDNSINANNLKAINEKNEDLKENVIKPKDNLLVKNKVIHSNDENIKSSPELISHSISSINKSKIEDKVNFGDKSDVQKVVSDSNNSTKDKINKKEKKKKLSSVSESFNTSFSSTCDSSDDSKLKKRKKKQSEESKKKFKTDSEKKIISDINNSKKVSEIIPKKSVKEDSNIANETTDTLHKNVIISGNEKEINDENSDNCEENSDIISKKKKQLIKSNFGLYDEKRMKLLDKTIDEIIAKPWNELESKDISTEIQTQSVVESEPTPTQSPPQPVIPLKPIQQSLIPEPQKPKSLLEKQNSISSSYSSSSTSSSVSSINLRLTESDLDLKMNVIMLVDGLLFVGEICPIQAPDIYGIILHGERQHRPHIYSQEEMLREAIREVKPSLEDLEEGQRVCAYWSTQYRHLYPGFVRSSSPHPNLVFVEFDDGDNGRISIDDIRLLPQDYPQMKINADPLKNLERRRRMSSCGKDSRTSKQISDNNNDNKTDGSEDNKQLAQENSSTTTQSKPKSDNKTNEESNKKLISLSNKVSKASFTNGKVSETTQSCSSGTLSMKLDMRIKKKKKHTKDDRHHRHHHKHHHCRHHRKCKKHKKSKEDNNNSLSSSSSISSFISVGKEKSTKLSASRVSSREVQKKDLDAQKVSNNNPNNNKEKDELKKSKSVTNRETDKLELKTTIRKRPKQQILDKSRNNSSTNESTTSISSNITRKRHAIDSKDNNNSNNETNSSPPKRRERMPSAEKSKIAPFLQERQLWHWSGKSIKRTGNKGSRNRKVYYKEIERGREHIRVDDCAVFLSTGRPHLPYIGRIDSMWQTGNGTMIVKVRWFYHPEETKGDSVPLVDKRGALFESSHFDVNDVQTISHKCQVISWSDYQQKRRENPMIAFDDPPNVYYLAGQYEALSGRIDMDSMVPLKDKSKDG